MLVPFSSHTPDRWDTSIATLSAGDYSVLDGGFGPVGKYSLTSYPVSGVRGFSYTEKGTIRNIVGGIAGGTNTAIYRTDSNGTLSNVSRVGGYTGIATWDFARFGSQIIGVNGGNAPQVATLSAAAFANLGGGPPTSARTVATVRDFVMMGYVSEVSGSTITSVSRVRWSAINNAASWTVSAATQADYQDLPDDGAVLKIMGGEEAFIFQERGVTKGTYVGSPLIFQFDKIVSGITFLMSSSEIGSLPVVEVDGWFYCVSRKGPVRINKSGQIQYIGNGDVDRRIFAFPPNPVSVAYHEPERSIWFGCDSGTGTLAYYIDTNKWGIVSGGSTPGGYVTQQMQRTDPQTAERKLSAYCLIPFLWGTDGALIPDAGGALRTANLITKPISFPSKHRNGARVTRARLVCNGEITYTDLRVYGKSTSGNTFSLLHTQSSYGDSGNDIFIRGRAREFQFYLTGVTFAADAVAIGLEITYDG